MQGFPAFLLFLPLSLVPVRAAVVVGGNEAPTMDIPELSPEHALFAPQYEREAELDDPLKQKMDIGTQRLKDYFSGTARANAGPSPAMVAAMNAMKEGSDLRVLVDKARTDFDAGKPGHALAKLMRAYEMRPRHPVIHMAIAEVHMAEGRFEEAEQFIDRALKHGIKPELHDFALARCKHLQGELEEAARIYWHMTGSKFYLPAAYQALAGVLIELNRLDDLRKLFKQQLERDPEAWPLLEPLGVMALNAKKYEEAMDYFDRLAAHPEAALIGGLRKVQALRFQGDGAASMNALEALLRKFPDRAEVYLMMAEAKRGDASVPEAIAVLRQGLARAEPKAPLYRRLGELQLEAGAEREALSAFLDGLNLHLLDRASWYRLLETMSRTFQGKTPPQRELPSPEWSVEKQVKHHREQALKLLAKPGQAGAAGLHLIDALLLDDKKPHTFNDLGTVSATFFGIESALPFYRMALLRAPKDAEAYRNLVVATQKVVADRATRQMAALRKAIEATPEDENLHHQLALGLARWGGLDKALPHFRTAVGLAPDRIDIHLDLAQALYRGGDLDTAIETASQAVEADKQSAEAQYWLAWLLCRKEKPSSTEMLIISKLFERLHAHAEVRYQLMVRMLEAEWMHGQGKQQEGLELALAVAGAARDAELPELVKAADQLLAKLNPKPE